MRNTRGLVVSSILSSTRSTPHLSILVWFVEATWHWSQAMQHVKRPNIMEIAASATVAAWSPGVRRHASSRPLSPMTTTTTSSIVKAKLEERKKERKKEKKKGAEQREREHKSRHREREGEGEGEGGRGRGKGQHRQVSFSATRKQRTAPEHREAYEWTARYVQTVAHHTQEPNMLRLRQLLPTESQAPSWDREGGSTAGRTLILTHTARRCRHRKARTASGSRRPRSCSPTDTAGKNGTGARSERAHTVGEEKTHYLVSTRRI